MTTGNRELTLNETFSRPDSRVQRLHPRTRGIDAEMSDTQARFHRLGAAFRVSAEPEEVCALCASGGGYLRKLPSRQSAGVM